MARVSLDSVEPDNFLEVTDHIQGEVKPGTYDVSNPDQAGDWYANQPDDGSFFTPEEEEANEAILWAMHAIQDMGLVYNIEEFVGHIHGLQMFVNMHVLHRLNPEFYNNWYTKGDTKLPPLSG